MNLSRGCRTSRMSDLWPSMALCSYMAPIPGGSRATTGQLQLPMAPRDATRAGKTGARHGRGLFAMKQQHTTAQAQHRCSAAEPFGSSLRFFRRLPFCCPRRVVRTSLNSLRPGDFGALSGAGQWRQKAKKCRSNFGRSLLRHAAAADAQKHPPTHARRLASRQARTHHTSTHARTHAPTHARMQARRLAGRQGDRKIIERDR